MGLAESGGPGQGRSEVSGSRWGRKCLGLEINEVSKAGIRNQSVKWRMAIRKWSVKWGMAEGADVVGDREQKKLTPRWRVISAVGAPKTTAMKGFPYRLSRRTCVEDPSS